MSQKSEDEQEFIPVANTYVGQEEADAVYATVKSGWISMGPKVAEFERRVAEYVGAKYAAAMNNGTSTLHAILAALEIGPGDEVILPALTYISSANVVMYQGATPVLCESDPDTFNVKPEHIRAKLTKRTRAFITVDLKGLPVDFDAFAALSAETGVPFISDSAESLGAIYKGRKVGAQALVHSFSFFANKNITTGEGGMVTTNDKALYDRICIIKNQGQEGRYNHTHLGNNYRMTDLAASFGIEQFKRVDWLMEEKAKLAAYYDSCFGKGTGVTPPFIPEYVTRPSWYMYSVKVDPAKRDALLRHLEEKRIDTRLSFPPVHIQPYYAKRFGWKPSDCPVAHDIFRSFVDIPIWVGMGRERQDRVAREILSFLSGGNRG